MTYAETYARPFRPYSCGSLCGLLRYAQQTYAQTYAGYARPDLCASWGS